MIFELDTDNDGIPDRLDTDSDSDGCPDAIEGDGGFTYADIQNDTLTGGVDADGIPTVTNSSGQAVGNSTDSSIQSDECDPCNSNSTLFTDNDTDGVGDVCDLDNDNDGILNTDECLENTDTSDYAANTLVFNNPTGPIASASALETGLSSYGGIIGLSLTEVGGGDIYGLSSNPRSHFADNPSHYSVTFSGSLHEMGTGVNVTAPGEAVDYEMTFSQPISNITLHFRNVDRGMWTFTGSEHEESLLASGPTIGYSASTRVLQNSTNDIVNGDGSIRFDATNPSTGITSITWTITSNPNNVSNGEAWGFVLTYDNPCDMDRDGIPDYLDLDSDNDGCPDALDGGGDFTYADIQNDTLTGGVDADGIPVVATSSGQSLGTAQDSTQIGAACSTMAENDINQTPQDTNVSGNILTNDSDPTDDTQSVQSATGLDAAGNPVTIPVDGTPTNVYDENGLLAGTIAINPDGSYDFDPAPTFTGEVPVDYVVVDENGATDTATLAIEVLPSDDPTQNDPPVANDDTNSTEQDVNVAGNVIAPNDSDPEGDALTVTAALADTDGDGMVDDVLTVGTPTDIYDENGVLAGEMTLNSDGTYSFDPEPTFTGEVPVDYTISDGNGGTDDATLTITVEPDNGNATYANDDASTGNEGDPQTGNIITNDNDPESDPQTVSSATDSDGNPITPGTEATLPSGGLLTINPDGTFDYTPDPDFVGTEVVEYVACDNATPTPACDTATLYLTTLPINTITSTDDFNNTPFETPVSADVSTNDVDEEGNNQTFALNNANGGMNPADGTVVLNPNGSYTFTPATGFTGTTEFEYEVCDDGSPVLCDTATVFLEVFPATDPENPLVIANPDVNTVLQDQTGTGNVMSNDLDPDDLDPMVTTTLTNATVDGVDEDGNPVTDVGTLTLNPDGSYTFTPAPGFTGTVTQPYTICNAEAPAVCDDTELIINVLPDANNTTFANDDAIITDAGVAVSNDVSTNDTDSEMDNQSITDFLVDTDGDGKGDTPGTVGGPTTIGGTNDMGVFVANAGEITLNSDGTYIFTPAPGFVGNVNVPYTACDDAAADMACDDATLVITVLDVKRDYGDAPVTYPAAWHRAVTDTDNNNVLDGATDVWLGTNTSFESSQLASPSSDGDQFDDAMTFGSGAGQFPLLAESGQTYDIDITVNSAQADLVFYAMWIDWNEDGIYDDFHTGSQTTASPATATITITAPAAVGNTVNVRLRADDNPFVATDFAGGKTNGEVEDFQALVVLPVKLTHFSGQAAGCHVNLRWHAETEENFSHYEIERSGDGQSFRSIETINGTGGPSNGVWYTFEDRSADEFNYYRLKMVDLDGSVDYSKIINVRTECTVDYKLELYPNPTTPSMGALNVNFFTEKEEVQVQVTDMQGRIVKRVVVGTAPNLTNSLQLDISDLPVGSYNLQLIGGGRGSSKIFIITNE